MIRVWRVKEYALFRKTGISLGILFRRIGIRSGVLFDKNGIQSEYFVKKLV